jgi:hypothetical protein
VATTDENVTFDAQQLVEDIETGEQEKPKINVDSDYEQSKKFATSDVDPAEVSNPSIVEPQGTLPTGPDASLTPKESKLNSDPDSFRELAKDANPQLKQES